MYKLYSYIPIYYMNLHTLNEYVLYLINLGAQKKENDVLTFGRNSTAVMIAGKMIL